MAGTTFPYPAYHNETVKPPTVEDPCNDRGGRKCCRGHFNDIDCKGVGAFKLNAIFWETIAPVGTLADVQVESSNKSNGK